MSTFQDYWDNRYQLHGEAGSGTFDHNRATNEWFYRAKFKRLREIIDISGINIRGSQVLDAACGNGKFVPFFISLGAREIFGLDISEIAVQNCQRKYEKLNEVHFYCGNLAANFPFPHENSFDLACVFEAIFCITEDRTFEAAVSHLCRAIKKDGFVIISDGFPPQTHKYNDRLVYHSIEHYKSIFKREGFKILGFYLQTKIFNRYIMPQYFQRTVEQCFPVFFYYLDRLALSMSKKTETLLRPPNIYYCVARKC